VSQNNSENSQNTSDTNDFHQFNQKSTPEKNRPTGGTFTTKGSESVKILKDTSEPETPKDPSKDQISSKGSPEINQRPVGEQLPTPLVYHLALERPPDSI